MSDDEFQFNLTEEDLRCISVEETKRRASNGQAPRLTQTTLTSSFFNGGGPLTTRQTLGYITKPKKSKDAGISDDSALSHPTHHALNEEELDTYIYPTNLPIRDYQYNIVQRALFSNLLCALPTGLGKTFIASTVMLNWYRWTKTAKIIFMAPTKPLVSQQIEACLGITGMPSHDSSVLIGGALTPKKREDEWNNKRIFFATPQTVENDLKKGILDPKTIACLVVDEAHRATGKFSYVMVVNFIKRFNNSFRLLALTATPSSTVEGVQNIIDRLHIARVEIRTEGSIDIRSYVHKREIERIKTEFSPDMEIILDLLGNAIQPLMKEAIEAKALFITDPRKLTAFGVTSGLQSYMASTVAKSKSFLAFKMINIMKILAKIGHAIGLLKYHGIKPFYQFMDRLKKAQYETVSANGKVKKKPPGKYMAALFSNPNYVEMEEFCETLIYGSDDFLGHPKMEHLLSIMIEFFSQKSDAPDSLPSNVIIFSAYRESAGVIIQALEKHKPMIRPHLFIGQANTGKKGQDELVDAANTGMTQKVQQDVVDKFKKGTYNTLVATSIGEEGLDIGEVDLIICYDASASPIRGLQRMGRTGRKRQGRIVMLLSDNEDKKLDKAIDNYQYIQKLLTQTDRFVLTRGDRILPEKIKPVCIKKEIEIPNENVDLLKKEDIIQEVVNEAKSRKTTKPVPKRTTKGTQVTNENVKKRKTFNMPENVVTGFVTASKLRATDSGNFVINEDSDKDLKTPKKSSEINNKVTNSSASKYDFLLNFDSESDEFTPIELDASENIGRSNNTILTPISSSIRELIFSPTPGHTANDNSFIATPGRVSDSQKLDIPSSPMPLSNLENPRNRPQDGSLILKGPIVEGKSNIVLPSQDNQVFSDGRGSSPKSPQLKNITDPRKPNYVFKPSESGERRGANDNRKVSGYSTSSLVNTTSEKNKELENCISPKEKIGSSPSPRLSYLAQNTHSPKNSTSTSLQESIFTKEGHLKNQNSSNLNNKYPRSPIKLLHSSPLPFTITDRQAEVITADTSENQAEVTKSVVLEKEQITDLDVAVKNENEYLDFATVSRKHPTTAVKSKTLGTRRVKPYYAKLKENRFANNQFLTENQKNELEKKYASKLNLSMLDEKGRLLMGYKEYDPLVGARMNVGCGLIPHSRSTVRFFQAIHFGRTVQSEEIKKLENLVKPNSNTKRGLQVKKESEPVYIP